MGSLNRIVLLGEIDSAVDVKATNSGESVANFSLQVRRPARADGIQSQSDQIQVVCWGELATQSEQLAIGNVVLVEGQIHNRQYDDQNGVRHYVTEVVAKELCITSTTGSALGAGNMEVQTNVAAEGIGSSEIAATAANSEATPSIETLASPKESFDFSDSESVTKATLESPPEFGEPVEEDIPF